MPPPRRLLLRVTSACNNGCAHCPLADIPPDRRGPRTKAEAQEALERGRTLGCTEVVFLRGEATLLAHLGSLCKAARGLGYAIVQLQTNGRRLADSRYTDHLVRAGLTHAEISLYGATAMTHDAVARVPGAWHQTTSGIRIAASRRLSVLANVHTLAYNTSELAAMVELAATLGARAVQLTLMRSMSPLTGASPSLAANPRTLSEPLSAAVSAARRAGIPLKTEAIPDCAFEDATNRPPDAWLDASVPMMHIDDVHRPPADASELRAKYRASPAACAGCRRAASCPGTWQAIVGEYGEAALRPQ